MPEIPQLSKKQPDWAKIGPDSLTAALNWDKIAPGETFERVEDTGLPEAPEDQPNPGASKP